MKKLLSLIAVAVLSLATLTVKAQNYTYGFENDLEGWTAIDVIDTGGTWLHSGSNLGLYDYTDLAHSGTGFAMCYSYVDKIGAYNTDSYLVSPQKYAVTGSSTLVFWTDYANDQYPEPITVAIATADAPTAADFTEIWYQNGIRYENWSENTIDLSSYAGQEIWIAFRDVNYDEYEIWLDDVTISNVTSDDPTPGPGPGPIGISENAAQTFGLYPNPATEVLNVKANDVKNIEIVNMLGQAVITTNVQTINVSDLTNGVYFVRVNYNNGTVSTQKFVKE